MTTEDDFHRALDANTNDWQTRLVFADWLQDRSDPRADGYRALGRLKKRPMPDRVAGWILGTDDNDLYNTKPGHLPALLPHDWFVATRGAGTVTNYGNWVGSPGRRDVENTAALAFAVLPAERRAELLVPSGGKE